MFNNELRNQYEMNEPKSYDEFEKMIKSIMEMTLQKITIKKGEYKPKLTEKAKMLREEKRVARKAFENATKKRKEGQT